MVAADKVSEPWQIFEWYMVEGLTRNVSPNNTMLNLPGREKVRSAIQDKVPLCANRYLKTPGTFGFHGVYRVLAHELGLENLGRIGEFGYELVSVWEKEQGLNGFLGSSNGKGREWRKTLRDAVKHGLDKGAVARPPSWSGWQFFYDHLNHQKHRRKRSPGTHKCSAQL